MIILIFSAVVGAPLPFWRKCAAKALQGSVLVPKQNVIIIQVQGRQHTQPALHTFLLRRASLKAWCVA